MKWLFRKLIDFYRKPTVVVSVYQKQIDAIQQLQVDAMVYRDTQFIESVIYNIEEYCIRLNQVLHALHGDLLFPNTVFELKLVKRCHFWRNQQGDFTDVAHYVNTFKELAVKILLRHEALLGRQDLPPIIETNLFRCQTIIRNLQVVVLQL